MRQRTRDDFPRRAVEHLAKRSAQRCSNPGCRRPTSGPHDDPSKAVVVGVAAHITAAAPGGPRYDSSLTQEQRRSLENGIWLCENCAKLVDSDVHTYTTDILVRWKMEHEDEVSRSLSGEAASPVLGGKRSAAVAEISDTQVVQERDDKTCLVDFRVSNRGGSQLLINRVRLEVIEVAAYMTMGFMRFSKVYDQDISSLEKAGDFVECSVSQCLDPGEVDRFGIRLIACHLGTGWHRGWSLRPTLKTNAGDVIAEQRR